MSAIEKSRMVYGRVGEQYARKAACVLEESGLTISSFIRNSIEHVANEGVVPPSGFPVLPYEPDKDYLRSVVRAIESRAMPGKGDYPELAGDALVERLRMEQYGY